MKNFLLLSFLMILSCEVVHAEISGTWNSNDDISCTRKNVPGTGSGTWTFNYANNSLSITGSFSCSAPGSGKWTSTSKDVFTINQGSIIDPKTQNIVGLFTDDPPCFGFTLGNSTISGCANANPKVMKFNWSTTAIQRMWGGSLTLQSP